MDSHSTQLALALQEWSSQLCQSYTSSLLPVLVSVQVSVGVLILWVGCADDGVVSWKSKRYEVGVAG